jgi:hypothetical protein
MIRVSKRPGYRDHGRFLRPSRRNDLLIAARFGFRVASREIRMRPIWILAGLAGVIATPVLAQTKIPPSHLYSNEPTVTLDKNYGMPPMPGPDLPQKPTAAKPKNQSESFTGLSTVGRPEAQPSDVPDFFQAAPVVAPYEPQTPDVPNFFQATPDRDPPRVAKVQSADSTMDTKLQSVDSTMETPLFTTTDEPPPPSVSDTMSTDAPAATKAGAR